MFLVFTLLRKSNYRTIRFKSKLNKYKRNIELCFKPQQSKDDVSKSFFYATNTIYKIMKTLKINNKWSIDNSGEGSTLIFAEKRLNKEKKTEYLFEDKFYYNNVQNALSAYLIKSLDNAKDVKEVLVKIDESLKEIKLCVK